MLNKNKLLYLAIGILFLYLVPLIVFWQNSYILILDNLDSNIVWFKLLAESGKIFSSNFSIIDSFMGGVPRVSLGSEFNIILWLYYFFDPYTAYVINQFLFRIIAFFGMYLLLERYVYNQTEKYLISIWISLFYALLPFWPSGGLSVAGLPLMSYVFLNFRNKRIRKIDWFVLLLVPFYSSLVLSYLFFISFIFLVWLYDYIKGVKNFRFLLAIGLFSSIFLLVEYRLLFVMILENDFISHRIEFHKENLNVLQSLEKSFRFFIFGHFHANSLHLYFIPIILLGLFIEIKNKVYKSELLLLLLLNIFIALWYGFWEYNGWDNIKDQISLLTKLDLSRYFFLTPLIWYVLLAFSIKIIHDNMNYKIIKIVYLFIIFQTIYLFFQSDFIQEHKRSNITYKSFYAEKQFAEIKNFINKIDKVYKVISLGIHPSIAQYNGFYTLDGYSANYPLEYKYEFRNIISDELDKSKDLEHYYDDWGSRAYLFSAELGRQYLYTKDDNKSVDININFKQLLRMNCEYILSAVKINNTKANNITLLNIFDSNESEWRIYLYKVDMPNMYIDIK